MKRKITIQLSEQLTERLEQAGQRPGASRAAIVEEALGRFLDSEAEHVDEATLLRRLDWMSSKLNQLDRDLRLANETVALHAQYHLTITPPMPRAHQRAACELGLERFEAFAAQVGRRVHLGTPLMRETVDRLGTTAPELFAPDIKHGMPLGTPSAESNEGDSEEVITEPEPELLAAVGEGGSNDGFREDERPSSP